MAFRSTLISSVEHITEILQQIDSGESSADDLLPLVYDELRNLALVRMRHERPDHTLAPTDLVHEAYLRLVDRRKPLRWNSRGHFFGAAAEAMRRILIENARKKLTQKKGERPRHVPLEDIVSDNAVSPELLIAFNEALERMEHEDPVKAQLVKLRCFAGLGREELSNVLGISIATVDRYWTYSSARIYCWLVDQQET